MHMYTRIIFQILRTCICIWDSNRPSKLKVYGPEGIKTVTEVFEQSCSIDSTFSKIISNVF